MSEVVRSVYGSQQDILLGIRRLYCPDGFECDLTYGNGQFWKGMQAPALRFDIDPQCAATTQADSRNVPVKSGSLNNMVFDPPFLTYVRASRTGNGNMVMAGRFSGYWTYKELQNHYIGTLKEAHRVLKRGGVMVFKCQDIIHNHRMHCTHANVISWAAQQGFFLRDLFVLAAKHRMPSPNRKGKQKHARIFHSYFLVLEKP